MHDALGPSFVGTKGPNGEESVTTVDLEKAMRQESRQLELPLEDRGEAPRVEGSGEAGTVAHGDERSGSEHLLMEEVVGRANLVGALKRVRQNKGSPGIDGMSVEELPGVLAQALGGDPTAVAGGDLPTEAGTKAGDTEEWGRGPGVGDSDRAGPVHPTSHPAGAATEVRPDVQSAQPRLPAWAPSTRCGARSAAIHPGRETMGGGCGPGEVFRPGEPRRADGAAGKADRG